jgi:hypothetical protein
LNAHFVEKFGTSLRKKESDIQWLCPPGSLAYGEPPETVEMPLQGTIASQLADIETPEYM